MEQNNSETQDDNNLEERFEQLSRQNQQQNERFETMDQRFTVMMDTMKNLSQDKCEYREGEHIAAQTCQKRARTSVECPHVRARTLVDSPEEQQESSHQVMIILLKILQTRGIIVLVVRRNSKRNASFLISKIWLTRFRNCAQVITAMGIRKKIQQQFYFYFRRRKGHIWWHYNSKKNLNMEAI